MKRLGQIYRRFIPGLKVCLYAALYSLKFSSPTHGKKGYPCQRAPLNSLKGTAHKYGFLTVGLIVSFLNAVAQNIERIPDAPWINANGGITISQLSGFSTDSLAPVQPPAYFLSGNINTRLFDGVDLPVSFMYTNDALTQSLPQPFNRFSMSPSYKWVKTYLGYTSMTFSPYTLAGHEFLGTGVELTPKGKFKVSAMFGRLNKAVEPDTLGTEPYFKRLGGGFKMDWCEEWAEVSINTFKAKDIPNSIIINNTDSVILKPEDNMALGGSVKLKLPGSISVMTEYAVNFMNHNLSRSDSMQSPSHLIFNNNGDISRYDAFKASVAQSSKIGKAGATYERVSPNYATLGAYYFNNDFENITADFSTSLIPKVNLMVNVGFQRDNIREQKAQNSRRFIYSVNGSFAASKKLSLNGTMTNVQTYMHIRDIYKELAQTNPYQNLDTLSFTQINVTGFFNANYVLQSTSSRRQNLNASITYQQASEVQYNDTKFTGNKIYNGMLSYQNSFIPVKLNLSGTANYNYNIMPTSTVEVLSLNLSVRKAFYEKFNTSLSTTYSSESDAGHIINIRLAGGYTWLERHNFNLGLTLVNTTGLREKTDYGGNFTYSYQFNCSLKRENKEFCFEGNF